MANILFVDYHILVYHLRQSSGKLKWNICFLTTFRCEEPNKSSLRPSDSIARFDTQYRKWLKIGTVEYVWGNHGTIITILDGVAGFDRFRQSIYLPLANVRQQYHRKNMVRPIWARGVQFLRLQTIKDFKTLQDGWLEKSPRQTKTTQKMHVNAIDAVSKLNRPELLRVLAFNWFLFGFHLILCNPIKINCVCISVLALVRRAILVPP